MNLNRFSVRSVLASGALGIGLAVAGPTIAASASTPPTPAAPVAGACTHTSTSTAGSLRCNISGKYRIALKCVDELRYSTTWEYGPTVTRSKVSTTSCPREGGVQFLNEGDYLSQP